MVISILFILFTLLMAVISIGSSIIQSITNFFFGRPQQAYGHTKQNEQPIHQSPITKERKRNKIFDHTEGEYVDFEEIKE